MKINTLIQLVQSTAYFVWILLLSLICSSGKGQIKQIGTPKIISYSKQDYGASTQNWAITQDRNGFVYFANNDGVLCFNGVDWELWRPSTFSPVRSIFCDSEDNIFVGLIGDFGMMKKAGHNQPVYESLGKLIPPEYRDFDDVWKIHQVNGGIVFQSFAYLFLLNGDKIKVLKPQRKFHFSYVHQNRLFIQEPGVGLFELINGELVKLQFWEDYKHKEIVSLLFTSDSTMLLGTTNDGMYIYKDRKIRPWNVPANDLMIKHSLYSATLMHNNFLMLGTILNGLVISDIQGNIIQSINTSDGLQNNTVLSIFVDQSSGLWLGLDNGIDYIEIGSPVSYIGASDIGAGYTCKVFNGNLYLGTNQGLYVCPFNNKENKDFILVENTAGQVWYLGEYDDELLCGHNRGTFRISGRNAENISDEEGAWKYIPLKDYPGLLLGGHYRGLVLLKRMNNRWVFDRKIKGFEESSRYLFQDESGTIWVGHGAKGIYRLALDKSLSSVKEVFRYSVDQGLPSKTGNVLFQYKDKLYVSAITGIYEYDKNSDSFIPSAQLDSLFGNFGRVKVTAEDDMGKTWFIAGEEAGMISMREDNSPAIVKLPLSKLKGNYINEFEFIYPYSEDHVFLGLEKGFVHYSSNVQFPLKKPFQAFIPQIDLPYLDSVIYIYDRDTGTNYRFPFNRNMFRFHFAAPFFENETPLQFSYYLSDFSQEWSDWSADSYKDFTTLREGEYRLLVKAKNVYGSESETASFYFEIAPPWYRSVLAYVLYFLLCLLSAFLVTKYIQYRFRLSKKRTEERHRRELLKLKNEKLQAQIIHRNKELANQTMGIIDKNRFLNRVNETLDGIQDFVVSDKAMNKIQQLKAHIKTEIDIEKQNKIFESYFDEVHEEFFNKIKNKYPNLTPNDLRICAFIRMNLTTQEIATILNISYRGAEISRYRLRKKLGLDRSTSLAVFLTHIG